MKRMWIVVVAIVSIVTPHVVCAHGAKENTQQPVDVVIAAAASLTDAINEIIVFYEQQEPLVHIVPTYGSSGTLRKQIEQGSPAEIFISANQSHMTILRKQSLVDESTLRDLFENKVVLISPLNTKKTYSSFTDCASELVTRMALGIPESVPAGEYAKQVFTTLGIWDSVAKKTVYAKDVRQVLTFVEMQEVDAGVVYATDAALSKKIEIVCEAPEHSHTPILYPGAVLTNASHKKEAKAFFDYLSTKKAAEIFGSYGFKVVQ